MQVYDFVLGHMQPVDNRLDIPDLYNESEGIELVTKKKQKTTCSGLCHVKKQACTQKFLMPVLHCTSFYSQYDK